MNALLEIACGNVIRRTDVAPPVMTHREKIAAVVEIIRQFPEPEIPVTHTFSPGIYAREITMPAGLIGVGHIHRHRHLNFALSGRAIVTMDGVAREIVAPFVFESEAGTQKAFQVSEDLRWVTVHANPKEIRDIVEMEREIFELPPEMIEAAIPIDDFRMKRNTLPCQD